MLRYAKAIADIIHKGFCWVFSSFFVNVLPRQTEKFWDYPGISLLLTFLAPEFQRWVNIEILTSNLTYFWWIVTQNHICVHGFPQMLRTWVRRGAPRNLMGGVLKSKHGGAWGELNMLSKNTCEGVNLIVKLPPISLQDSKCTKNKLLHTYFSRILARF